MRNTMQSITLVIIVVILTIVTGCASSKSDPMASPSVPPAPAESSGFGISVSTQSTASRYDESSPASGVNWDAASEVSSIDRKIIRTGSMTLEVSDISESLAEIAAIAGGFNGYVVSSSQRSNTGSDPTGQISIRIPADRYENALQKLRELATKVIYENSSSQDVTEQYTDLQAQLSNYQATESQFLEILKKAEDVQDILEVQKELSNVRGNIERVKGRIQYLEKTSETSLIDISLKKARPIGESSWDVGGIFKGAVDGLIGFGKVLLAIIIWLLVFSPIWIIVLVIILVVRRKKAKKIENTKNSKET